MGSSKALDSCKQSMNTTNPPQLHHDQHKHPLHYDQVTPRSSAPGLDVVPLTRQAEGRAIEEDYSDDDPLPSYRPVYTSNQVICKGIMLIIIFATDRPQLQ